MPLLFFKNINKSFSAKVFTYLLGAMVFITVTFNIFYLQFQQNNLEKEMLKDGRMLSRILATNTRLGIFAEDRKQISESLKTAINEEGIIGACAYNLEGKLLQSEIKPGWAQTEICPTVQNINGDFLKQFKISPEVLHQEDKKTVEFWSPVLVRSREFTEESLYFEDPVNQPDSTPHTIGFVGVVFDKGPIQQSIREILAKNILILTVFLCIGSIAGYYIIQSVTKPLNQLIANIKDQGLKIETKDELGMLADTYSGMVDTLSNSFETINELKTGLEKKVRELEHEINIRKNVEAALRESEEKFRSISEGIADGVAIIQDGKFAWLNKSFCNIFGYSNAELIGNRAETLLETIPQQSTETKTHDQPPVISPDSPYKHEAFRKDGTPIILDTKASESIFAGRSAIELIIRDVTDKKKAELEKKELEIKALSQSKLAAIGEIATGIAHEINQPLTYIKIAYQSTLRDMDNDHYDREEMNSKFKEALRQVERITAITEHLRSFGRNDLSVFSWLSLPKILDNTMILMGERIRLRNLTFIRQIEDNLPQIYGNKMQLEQVFINLLQNSIDAMADDGTGKIRVEMRRIGNFLQTTFADTGPGIEATITEKIFIPFFTTKITEKGTGLGLAIAHNIIKEHNGTIMHRQEPDWGATFVISLPVMEHQEKS